MMKSKVDISVIDCQTLNDISDDVTKFDMLQIGSEIEVEIELKDKTLFLGIPRDSPKKPKYAVTLIDLQDVTWSRILEER